MKAGRKIAVFLLAAAFVLCVAASVLVLPIFVRADEPASIAFGKINERSEEYLVNGQGFFMYGSAPTQGAAPVGSGDDYVEKYAFYMGADGSINTQPDLIKILKNPVDITSLTGTSGETVSQTALTFWMYFSSLDGVSDTTMIQIGTENIGNDVTGKCLVGEGNWLAQVKSQLKPGWNKISVNLGMLTKYDQSLETADKHTDALPDFSKISYVRFWWGAAFDKALTAESTQFRMGLTDVRFEQTSQTEMYKVVETQPIACDADTAVTFSDTSSADILVESIRGNATVSSDVPAAADAQSVSETSLMFDNGIGVIEFTPQTPVNASALSAGQPALSLWLYLNDVDYITGSADTALQVSSTGTFEGAYGFPLKNVVKCFRDGWNHVIMKIPSGAVALNAINYVRFYAVGGTVDGNIRFGANNIQIVNTNMLEDFNVIEHADTATPAPAVDEVAFGAIDKRGAEDVYNGYVFGMYGSDWRKIAPRNAKEQGAEIYSFYMPGATDLTKQFEVKKSLVTPVDLTAISENKNDIALTFWIYFSSLDGIMEGEGGSELEVGSTADMDSNNELKTNFFGEVRDDLVPGWNRISVNLGKMAQTGDVDLSAIRFVRMYIFPFDEAKTAESTGFRMGLSDVRFVRTEQAETICVIDTEPVQVFSDQAVVLSDTASFDGWSSSDGTVSDKAPNGSSATGTKKSLLMNAGQTTLSWTGSADVSQTSYPDNKITLSVWLYLSDASLLETASEASMSVYMDVSAGTGGQSVNLKTLAGKLVDGWNHIYLKCVNDRDTVVDAVTSLAINITGAPDLRIGVHNPCVAESNIMDAWYLAATEKDTSLQRVVFDDGESTDGWANVTMQNTNAHGNGGSILVNAGATVAEKEVAIDLSGYPAESTVIGMWIYVYDVASLASAQVSFGSDVDAYCSYDFAEDDLRNGWNKVQIRIAAMDKAGDADLASVSFVKFTFAYAQDASCTIALDDIEAYYSEGAQDFTVLDYIPYKEKVDEVAFGAIDKRTNNVDVINNVFGMWGSDWREVAPKNSKEKAAEIYSFHMASNMAATSLFDVKKTLYTPIDISAISSDKNEIALTFWIYFSSLDGIMQSTGAAGEIVASELELGSTTDLDVGNELKTNFFGEVRDDLVPGWNRISINLGKMTQTGNVDLTAIRFVRMYISPFDKAKTAEGTGFRMGLSDVRFVRTEQTETICVIDTEPVQVFSEQAVLLSDTVSFNGWSSSAGTIVTDNVPQGSAAGGTKSAIMMNAGQTQLNWTGTADVSQTSYLDNKMTVSVWLYLSDTGLLSSASAATLTVRMNASAEGVQILDLKSQANRFVNGWNHIYLKCANNRGLNISAVTSLELYITGAPELQIGVHYPRIMESNIMDPWYLAATEEDASLQRDVFDDGESTEGWSANVTKQNTNALGTGGSILVNAGETVAEKEIAVDMSAYPFESAVIGLWLFVDDAKALTAAQVSFGSGADAYYSYDFAAENIRNGWNHIQIRVSAMDKTGSVDLSAVSFVKFTFAYAQDASCTIALDDIVTYLRTNAAAFAVLDYIAYIPEAPVDPTHIVDIGTTDSSKGFAHTTVGLYTEKGPTGKGAILAASPHDIGITYSFDPVDLADTSKININNAVLSFWMYFSNVDLVTSVGYVELTSVYNATVDEVNKYSWSFESFWQDIKPGWNKVVLKMGGDGNLSGTVDLTDICFFRIYNRGENFQPYPDYTMKMLLSDIQVYETDLSELQAAQITEYRDFEYDEPKTTDVVVEELDNGYSEENTAGYEPYAPPQVVDDSYSTDVDNTKDVLLIVIPAVAAALALAAAAGVTVVLRKKRS